MRHLVATAPEPLEAVSQHIHDAWFDADTVVYHERARTLVVPFAQEVWPSLRVPVRRTWWSTEYRVAFMRGTLAIHDVERVEIPEGWGDAGMLVGAGFDAGRRQVELWAFADPLRATVGALRVEAVLTDEVAGHVRRRVGRGFGIQADGSAPAQARGAANVNGGKVGSQGSSGRRVPRRQRAISSLIAEPLHVDVGYRRQRAGSAGSAPRLHVDDMRAGRARLSLPSRR